MWSQLASLASQVSETVAPVAQEFREALREGNESEEDGNEKESRDGTSEVAAKSEQDQDDDGQQQEEGDDDDKGVDNEEQESKSEQASRPPLRVPLTSVVNTRGREWFASVVSGVKEFREALNESDSDNDEKQANSVEQQDDASSRGIDHGHDVSEEGEFLNDRIDVAESSIGNESLEVEVSAEPVAPVREEVTEPIGEISEAVPEESLAQHRGSELDRRDEVVTMWGMVSSVKDALTDFQEALREDEQATETRAASVSSSNPFLDVELSSETFEHSGIHLEVTDTRTEFLYREEAVAEKHVPIQPNREEESDADPGMHAALVEDHILAQSDTIISVEELSRIPDNSGQSTLAEDKIPMQSEAISSLDDAPRCIPDDIEVPDVENNAFLKGDDFVQGEMQPTNPDTVSIPANIDLLTVPLLVVENASAVAGETISSNNSTFAAALESDGVAAANANMAAAPVDDSISHAIAPNNSSTDAKLETDAKEIDVPHLKDRHESVPTAIAFAEQFPLASESILLAKEGDSKATVEQDIAAPEVKVVNAAMHKDLPVAEPEVEFIVPASVPVEADTNAQEIRAQTKDSFHAASGVGGGGGKRRALQEIQALKKQNEKLRQELEGARKEFVASKRENRSDESDVAEREKAAADSVTVNSEAQNKMKEALAEITSERDILRAEVTKQRDASLQQNVDLQSEVERLQKNSIGAKEQLERERAQRTALEQKLVELESQKKQAVHVLEQRLSEELAKSRSNMSDKAKVEEMDKLMETERKQRIDAQHQLDALKEQFHKVSESLEKQTVLNRSIAEREQLAARESSARLTQAEQKLRDAGQEMERLKTSYDKYVSDLRGAQSQLESDLAFSRKEIERMASLEADLEFALKENAKLEKLTHNQADKSDLDRALEEVMLLQSEASRNASIHLQRIQALETELQATKSDVITLSSENSSAKTELDKLRKALLRMTQELEREETTHRQKVVALRAEVVKTKDEYEQLMAMAEAKQDELKQELMRAKEELSQAHEAVASASTSSSMKQHASSSSPSSSASLSYLVDVRLVNQLLMAFVKRGRENGDNGKREIIETMSRILNWSDVQKQEVLASYSLASSIKSTTSGVVARGFDLLLSSGSSSNENPSVASGAFKQAKPMTTDAAAKLLERESFEQVFLKEFLAKESTSEKSTRQVSAKPIVQHPATPLSSRSLSQTSLSLGTQQVDAQRLPSPLANPVTTPRKDPSSTQASQGPVIVKADTSEVV